MTTLIFSMQMFYIYMGQKSEQMINQAPCISMHIENLDQFDPVIYDFSNIPNDFGFLQFYSFFIKIEQIDPEYLYMSLK